MKKTEDQVIVGFSPHDCPHCFLLQLMDMIVQTRPELKYKRVVAETLHAVVDFINLHSTDLPRQVDPCIDALRRYFADAVSSQTSTTPGSFIVPGSNTHQ